MSEINYNILVTLLNIEKLLEKQNGILLKIAEKKKGRGITMKCPICDNDASHPHTHGVKKIKVPVTSSNKVKIKMNCINCGKEDTTGLCICPRCSGILKSQKTPQTQYDRIRNMTVEELAVFLYDLTKCYACTFYYDGDCRDYNNTRCHTRSIALQLNDLDDIMLYLNSKPE